jgi:hypothetical protein
MLNVQKAMSTGKKWGIITDIKTAKNQIFRGGKQQTQASNEPGFSTDSGGSSSPWGRHWEQGQSFRKYSNV